MKLYKHKAICEYCNEQEFDGMWIRKTFHAVCGRHLADYQNKNPNDKQFHYICYKCLNMWFIQNDC